MTPEQIDLSNPLGIVFGLMPPETQEAMKAHGGPWEFYTDYGWRAAHDPGWHTTFAYRVKPAPKVVTVTAPIWIVGNGLSYHCVPDSKYPEGWRANIIATIQDGKIIKVELAE